MIYMSFFLGLVLICKGGDWFVEAAAAIAERFGIPKFIIGATIVSLATTMPEILVSVSAALKGSAAMAIGNAVGSVSANTGIILGTSMLCLPAVIDRKEYLTKNVLYIGSVLLLIMTFFDRTFDSTDSLFMLTGGILFMGLNIKNAMNSRREPSQELVIGMGRSLFFFLFGAACIVVGSELLIDSSCAIARMFQIPEEVISVTLVAMGTSLPEFITTMSAILKKESSLSVGNIVGANVIDTTFILPICTLLTGEKLSVSEQMASMDAPICFILAVTALVPMLVRGRIKRMDGVITMGIYAVYFLSLSSQL